MNRGGGDKVLGEPGMPGSCLHAGEMWDLFGLSPSGGSGRAVQ